MSSGLLHKIRYLMVGTLRHQLILGVALVHAVLMAMFVYDLTVRQKDLLLERQTDQAQALARSVATSAAGWVASRDFYGLQEIVTAQSRYPELLFAMVLDKEGKVLAHSDTSLLGRYLKDLPDTPQAMVLKRSPQLVDAVSPVMLAGQMVGWVRVGLGQERTAERLAHVTRDGVIYAFIAIIVGSILAWYMGTQLTRKLRVIQHTADAVSEGNVAQRVAVEGDDEVAHVAHAFNQMLNRLDSSRAELTNSEERLKLAMNATSDGLWDWDLKTDVIYYSPRWKLMLGYEDHELVNGFDTWAALVDQEDIPKTMEKIQACRDGKTEGFEVEFRMKHKQGQWVPILSRGHVVRDENNEAIRLVGTHGDMTRRKAMEKELIEHRDRLEVKVRDRTLELEEAKQFAENANQEKSRFLANMSHELRTPMHAIMSFAMLALKRTEDEKLTRFINNIHTSAIRLTSLLNDLLDLSKLESGKVDVNFVEQSLDPIINQSLNEVGGLLMDKNISISQRNPDDLMAMVDQKLIMQVLVNLLSNAIKFSPENSEIEILVDQNPHRDDENDHALIRICVIDQGIGIPENEIEAVFDKFVQSSMTKSDAGGTGLGLPIIKEIMELHSGAAWAQSPPQDRDVGTALCIEFPAVQGLPDQISFTSVGDAINTHSGWLEELRDMFKTKVVPDAMSSSLLLDHHLCSMDRWLESLDCDDEHVKEVSLLHREFHLLASETVAYYRSNDLLQAKERLGRVEVVSDELMTRLQKLM